MLRSLSSTMLSTCIELQQTTLHLSSPKFHCITAQSELSGTVRWDRELVSLAQPRHPGLDIARRGRQQLGTVTVALDRAGRGPLPWLRTDPGGQLRLGHLLKGRAEDLTDRRRERAIDLGQSTGEFG